LVDGVKQADVGPTGRSKPLSKGTVGGTTKAKTTQALPNAANSYQIMRPSKAATKLREMRKGRRSPRPNKERVTLHQVRDDSNMPVLNAPRKVKRVYMIGHIRGEDSVQGRPSVGQDIGTSVSNRCVPRGGVAKRGADRAESRSAYFPQSMQRGTTRILVQSGDDLLQDDVRSAARSCASRLQAGDFGIGCRRHAGLLGGTGHVSRT